MQQYFFSRREMIAGGASFIVADKPVPAAAQVSQQDRLRQHVHPVRTVDFADQDFSDLAALGAAVGDAQLVQLGEPSHGAGSCFVAKSRIVKYLHERCGFDVLIWESGLYDVALAQAGMRGSDDAVTAARRGVFDLWSMAAEVKPLFEYIKQSQSTIRPLEMAGFDMQVTADGSVVAFAADLRDFVGALSDRTLRTKASLLAEDALAARERLFAAKFTAAADLAALRAATHGLGALFDRHRAQFERARGKLGTAFMLRCIENMRADAMFRAEFTKAPKTTPVRENSRDAANASNLRWLLQERYRGRKAIVWAHDVHVMKAYYDADFHNVHVSGEPGDMKPTGVFINEWFGNQVYTIGMTTYQGEDGFAPGGPAMPISPAPAGSFEEHLHALGNDFAFLDFRALDNNRQDPLRNGQRVRLPKYDSNKVPDVGLVYDGLFYIDRMHRATRVPVGG